MIKLDCVKYVFVKRFDGWLSFTEVEFFIQRQCIYETECEINICKELINAVRGRRLND